MGDKKDLPALIKEWFEPDTSPTEEIVVEVQDAILEELEYESVSQDVSEELQMVGIDSVVEETVGNDPSALDFLKEKFPSLLGNCNSWKDVFKEASRISREVHKEYFFIQVFASGVILSYMATNPFLKSLGPVLASVGYRNSSVIQRGVSEEDVRKVLGGSSKK